MLSTSRGSSQPAQALWPWILTPVIVLVVFYILHYEVLARHAPAPTASTLSEPHTTQYTE